MYVITGGGTGIGRALALELAFRGKSVLIIGRRAQALEDTASNSPLIQCLCADVSSAEGIESIKNFLKNTPAIDGLINNAGILEPLVPLKEMQVHDWQQVLKTNLDAALFLPQQLQAQLAHGRVMNIGSGAAYFPIKGWAAYCVSKAALSMLTRCWQLESESIAFASVMPGIADTHMQVIARDPQQMDPEQVRFYNKLMTHNRLVSVETVALFLAWLLLDVDKTTYVSQEWDIYETSHHKAWLKPPHQVLHWDF